MRLYVFALTWLLVGCTVSDDVPAAEQAIATFHSDLNAGNFEKIYNNSTTEFKSSTKKSDFVKLLSVAHSKLGAFVSGKAVEWLDNETTRGHLVEVRYKASYKNGGADERFIYRVSGGDLALIGYHLNSNALLLS
jgi:hypothetical protein